MRIVKNATHDTPFVGTFGYPDLVWLKPTFNTQFHLSFGTLLSSTNRVSSGAIQTVNTPLEINVKKK